MACLICERSAEYELVRDGQAEAEVCRACTEEFLAVDEGDPTCVYCDNNGVYDVLTGEGGGFPDAEDTGDTFATPYESVLCEEHFEELGGEKPAGSPEAADEDDVEGDEAAAAEGEADDETTQGAEAEAEGGAEGEGDVAEEGDESESGEAETGNDSDVDETGDAEIEAEQSPDGGDDATTKTEGNVTERDGS